MLASLAATLQWARDQNNEENLATGIVEDWPDEPRRAEADRAALEETARRAEPISVIGRS